MKKSVFEYNNYKIYLNQWIQSTVRRRGERTRIAEALRCHTAYISQVLNGNADFSLEQADILNSHLGHSSEESHFFLLLVQHSRSGTNSLKEYFKNQMNRILESRLILKNRVKVDRTLSNEDQMLFYSSWHYGAVHILISIPHFQNKEALSKALNLSLHQVAEILTFLERIGLAINEGKTWKVGSTNVFLGSSSPMINRHHTNWRMKAISSLDNATSEDMHFSAPISISKEDFIKVREIFVESINRAREIVSPSKDEVAACYCIDLFRLDNN